MILNICISCHAVNVCSIFKKKLHSDQLTVMGKLKMNRIRLFDILNNSTDRPIE